jgi:hypothetical protein
LQAAQAPHKLSPVGGHAVRLFISRQESYTLSELRVEAVACQQSMCGRIELRHNKA